MKKRGLSPLIATILIVGFVIILAILIFSMTKTVFDEEINSTQETIDIYSLDTSFSFSCENIIDEEIPLNTTNILLINEYNGQIDAVLVMLENESNVIKEINLSAWETTTFNFTGSINNNLKIIPMVRVNGVLEALAWKAEIKNCGSIDVPLLSPCENGNDDDEDGVKDNLDPDCHTDLNPANSDSYNASLSEEGTYSCHDCNSCETAINNENESGGEKYYIFNSTTLIPEASESCIVINENIQDIKINCNSAILSGTGNSYGFDLLNTGITNIEIFNCKINEFTSGIAINSNNILIHNNSFGYNDNYAVTITGGSNITISNNSELNKQNYAFVSAIGGSEGDLTISNNNLCVEGGDTLLLCWQADFNYIISENRAFNRETFACSHANYDNAWLDCELK